MQAAVDTFCQIVDQDQQLQGLIIHKVADGPVPVLIIDVLKPKHLVLFTQRCIIRGRVEQRQLEKGQHADLTRLHETALAGFLLVYIQFETSTKKFATAVKCKDLEAEHAINRLMPDTPNRRAWPWSTLRPQTITSIRLTRSDLVSASQHPQGLISVRDKVSLSSERYRSGMTRERGYGDISDMAIISVNLKHRQTYQLSFYEVRRDISSLCIQQKNHFF